MDETNIPSVLQSISRVSSGKFINGMEFRNVRNTIEDKTQRYSMHTIQNGVAHYLHLSSLVGDCSTSFVLRAATKGLSAAVVVLSPS